MLWLHDYFCYLLLWTLDTFPECEEVKTSGILFTHVKKNRWSTPGTLSLLKMLCMVKVCSWVMGGAWMNCGGRGQDAAFKGVLLTHQCFAYTTNLITNKQGFFSISWIWKLTHFFLFIISLVFSQTILQSLPHPGMFVLLRLCKRKGKHRD